MIKKASDVKLSVLPLLISVEHLYYKVPAASAKATPSSPAMIAWPTPRSRSSFLGF